jgi:segregation and condensation protein B
MKNLEKLTNIIESILFVSGTQVAIADIADKLEVTDKEINDAVKALKEKYSGNSGVQLLTFNKKLQFCSNPSYAEEVSSVLNPIKERELSKSMLEVAAIIAYKQPVTRIDLEEIRGNSEYAVQKLLELGVIEPVGRKDAVGKPVLFGTTDKFLKRFQISSLDELPDYEDLINRIQLIRGDKQDDDYLYTKDVYVDPEDDRVGSVDQEVAATSANEDVGDEDFDLPDISEEELPEFLKGEEVEKF